MATGLEPFTIAFPESYDAQAECETPHRGYLSDVVVQFEDGASYRLYFSDSMRLQQTLEDDMASGRPYYAEPGLVVLPEVTSEAIRRAVAGLWREGFFQHLKSL